MKTMRNAKKSLRYAFGGFAVGLAALTMVQLNAQSIANHDFRARVTIDAANIEWHDRQNRVLLRNNVLIQQAGLRLNAARAEVNYTDNGGIEIQQMRASGGVTIISGNETAKGDVAVYDLNKRIITMAGNVRLRRGGDTLSGGRLVIDLKSGISSVDGAASSGPSAGSGQGRVSGSFAVPQD